MVPRPEESIEQEPTKKRIETRTELKCRMCSLLFATGTYSYSQKKKKHRRRCAPCVAYALYRRGDGPKPGEVPGNAEEKFDEEYGQIELVQQLLPPQKLSGVSHLKTIVVEPTASGPGQRRARVTETPKATKIPVSYQNTPPMRKSRAERDVAEELMSDYPSSSSTDKNQNSSAAKAGTSPSKKQASNKAKRAHGKPSHERKPSAADEARALYARQLQGRRKMKQRASRHMDEEDPGELMKGKKGRNRLNALDGGYPRESMKPGPERVIGGH